jgi:soluble lytic murein transglycosylase-like protein
VAAAKGIIDRSLAATRMALGDIASGARVIVHNGLALTGFAVVLVVAVLALKPELVQSVEDRLYAILMDRQPVKENTAERAVAVDPAKLTAAQARVADWLARKYHLAPEPMAAFVQEADRLSKASRLPPNLILAVAAIESNFHPFIESEAGAQGLMQVVKNVHRKRFEQHGGAAAAFDPLTNMRVGVQILGDFIHQQGGNVDAGLRAYLGGVALEEDNGYVAKVRAEEARLNAVAAGQKLAVQ